MLELIRVGAKRSANLGTKKSANRSYVNNNLYNSQGPFQPIAGNSPALRASRGRCEMFHTSPSGGHLIRNLELATRGPARGAHCYISFRKLSNERKTADEIASMCVTRSHHTVEALGDASGGINRRHAPPPLTSAPTFAAA